MYYIINQKQQIIAIDDELSKILAVKDINELYTKLALNEIQFSSQKEELSITTSTGTELYKVQNNKLSGILGDMTLMHITTEEDNQKSEQEPKTEELLEIGTSSQENVVADLDSTLEEFTNEEKELLLEDDFSSDKEVVDENTEQEHMSLLDDKSLNDETKESFEEFNDKAQEQGSELDKDISAQNSELEPTTKDTINDTNKSYNLNTISLLNNEIKDSFEESDNNSEENISLLDNDNIVPEDRNESTETQNNDKDIDFIMPDTLDTKDESFILKDDTESQEQKNDPIVIDAEKISKEIGISVEDYNNFLKEYIDMALALEKDMQSEKYEEHTSATETLSHLSNVLHLPMITSIIKEIRNTSMDAKNTHILSLYDALARLTTTELDIIDDTNKIDAYDNSFSPSPLVSETELMHDASDKLDIDKSLSIPSPSIPETVLTDNTSNKDSFGSIDLKDVNPIHFDFRSKDAADELDLPLELIEEFVHDFIQQAHTETDKMLEAYEKGDLDSIEKIAHLLKGVSSNLHIDPLAETLLKIQACKKSDKLEALIKDYWGHFLSFETQINLISKK